MRYFLLFLTALVLSACTFDEPLDEDQELEENYDPRRARSERAQRIRELEKSKSQREESNSQEESAETASQSDQTPSADPQVAPQQNNPAEITVSPETAPAERPSSVVLPSNPAHQIQAQTQTPQNSLPTVSGEQNPPQNLSPLTTSSPDANVIASESAPEPEVIEIVVENAPSPEVVTLEPQIEPVSSPQIRGVYVSNQTDLPIFYVDKVENQRISISPDTCFSRPYPEETGLSRLYFSIVTEQNEVVCDNCMINESLTSSYFLVETASVYSSFQIFNGPAITIAPGTVIFNQSEESVKNNCGLN